MDHRLPLGASFAATLAMLLKKEREQDWHGRTPPFCGWNSAMPPDRRNWPRNGSRSFGPRDFCPSLGSRVKNDRDQGDDTGTVAWVTGILKVYARARRPRPAVEEGPTHQAVRAREQRAR